MERRVPGGSSADTLCHSVFQNVVQRHEAAAFHAVAKGIVSLSAARGLLGLGEAGLWPGAVKSNGEWFPAKQRALAQGIFNSGASIGNVIAPIVIVFLYAQFGWKATYVILGIVGLIWVIPWLMINKSTPMGVFSNKNTSNSISLKCIKSKNSYIGFSIGLFG